MKNINSSSEVKSESQASFNQNRAGTGTKEWSDKSVNCCKGCDNFCRYCYGMFGARRRKQIADILDWQNMTVKPHMVDAAARKFEGVVMFPTTHDITPSVLPACLETLNNLLSHGNEVLIVSKPHLSVIKTLCTELAQYREQIQFRFTIGSLSPATIRLWETNAPLPAERIAALRHAHRLGYRTSISMEPMLGGNAEMIELVKTVEPYVTDTIWLGKLNRGVTSRGLSPEDAARLEVAKKAVRHGQRDSEILALVAALEGNPKVRWKDSIKDVIAADDKVHAVGN